MHLINYLQPIYASLVAGHVFCTSNGMLNWFENHLPRVIHSALQETRSRSAARSLLPTRSAARCTMPPPLGANLRGFRVKLVSRRCRRGM